VTTPQRVLLTHRIGIRSIVSNLSGRVTIGATLRRRGRRGAVRLGGGARALSAGGRRKGSVPIGAAARRRIATLARAGRVEIDITARGTATGDRARLRVRLQRGTAG
jgi:hypothetical protein